jgi:signal transduction histidine kinase/phage shock protein PspC (stress-responsive transcriptional regulator)
VRRSSTRQTAAPADPAGGRRAPRLTRRRDGRVLAGVAGGVADHLGVDVLWVRAAFAALIGLNGSGVLAYGLLWLLAPLGRPTGRAITTRERQQAFGLAAVAAGLALAVGLFSGLGGAWVTGPIAVALVGAAVVWREADQTQRRRQSRQREPVPAVAPHPTPDRSDGLGDGDEPVPGAGPAPDGPEGPDGGGVGTASVWTAALGTAARGTREAGTPRPVDSTAQGDSTALVPTGDGHPADVGTDTDTDTDTDSDIDETVTGRLSGVWVAVRGAGRTTVVRSVAGAVLVLGGITVFLLGRLDLSQVQFGLLAVLATLAGTAMLTVPWWLRLVRDLGDERRARIRTEERTEIAAHLHDSVLQTLALIQKQADAPREVRRLARGQERELRSWLYGPQGYGLRGPDGDGPGNGAVRPDDGPGLTLAGALTTAAAEVEDTYSVRVNPVVVGDTAMSEPVLALVAAAREAMVNAAKHAGVPEVSVYAEAEPDTVHVFVRDRGAGFDPDAVPPDRHGLADSVRRRMARHGGTVRLRTAPGEGTEVTLEMPVRVAAGRKGGTT